MIFVNSSYEIMTSINGLEVLKHIERCGRVCYKSEDKITGWSCVDFVKNLIKRGHESVLEHYSFTVKFITDRGVSHEIVRHRLASYSQESTRYCNYAKKGLTFVIPRDMTVEKFSSQYMPTLTDLEWEYNDMITSRGYTPQEARAILPNCLKTELVMTANLREWRHFLKMRTAQGVHPELRGLCLDLLKELETKIPVVFDDILKGENT